VNLWHDLPLGSSPPEQINVIIEIPSNTRNKYEFDHKRGYIRLDRVLSAALHYPADYGLIPRTLYDDGDPLDVLVIIKEPTFPGCVISVRPIGLFSMEDQGTHDDKILAVPKNDPLYRNHNSLHSVADHFLEEIAHFFRHYKDLEGKRVQANGWQPKEEALQAIIHAHQLYLDAYEEPAG
jgi:inorganic pyrophosphatase